MIFLLMSLISLAQIEVTASEPTTDAGGVVRVRLTSSAQAKPVEIRLLVPGNPRSYLYVLPVEKEGEARYGDGFAEAKRLGLHERYGMVVVAPGFAQLPWYADHPSDLRRRDEAHLLQTVIPWVEKRVPLANPVRLLLGFSKSGWGAWSLLLRHPDLFRAAAAWDAPLLKEKPDQFGMEGAFATQENFEEYHLAALLREKAATLRERTRLVHLGYGIFREHHQKMQALLEELRVPAVYADCPARKHVWDSGWMAAAAAALDTLGR
jgi:hypothetical protein